MKKDLKLCESDYRFMCVIWENEPLPSGKLVELCKAQLGWSKATTYTVIRRLGERGVLKNENTIVSSLITKEQVQQAEMEEMMDKTFEGSIPAFIAAFANSNRLTPSDIAQLEEFIETYKG